MMLLFGANSFVMKKLNWVMLFFDPKQETTQ